MLSIQSLKEAKQEASTVTGQHLGPPARGQGLVLHLICVRVHMCDLPVCVCVCVCFLRDPWELARWRAEVEEGFIQGLGSQEPSIPAFSHGYEVLAE